MKPDPSRQKAIEMDSRDELARFRDDFIRDDPQLIYLDGNSLGRLPKGVQARMDTLLQEEWGADLIRSWNSGWFDAPQRIGDKIGQIAGAAPGQVVMSDSTSVNLFKLTAAALEWNKSRKRIVSDVFNFPSDLYVLQGIIHFLGGHHELALAPSSDGVNTDLEALYDLIDEDTALVTLSHVAFKSGYLYDLAAVTEKAHQKGALVLWDLSHSVGVVPADLDVNQVDFAIGCTYKYLNGGPGSPAFLYVNRTLQDKVVSPIWGWFGQQAPFRFDLNYQPLPGVSRFLAGTPPLLSLLAVEAGLEPALQAGLPAIRCKSQALTAYLVELFDSTLAPLGFDLGTPREPSRRGSHISIRHPQGYRINRALIDEMKVIPDFREPDNIRLGLAPLYTSFEEVWEGVDRIRQTVQAKRYQKYPPERMIVT